MVIVVLAMIAHAFPSLFCLDFRTTVVAVREQLQLQRCTVAPNLFSLFFSLVV